MLRRDVRVDKPTRSSPGQAMLSRLQAFLCSRRLGFPTKLDELAMTNQTPVPTAATNAAWTFVSQIPKPGPLVYEDFNADETKLVADYANERLGVASSLLLTLAAKCRPSAMHCIRVALGCSGWGRFMKLSDPQCRNLEIAGALHDLGKVGVCDSVLRKPGLLTREELALVDYHRQNVMSILQPSLVSQEIAETIFYGIAFYDGSKAEFNRKGEALPLTARMLSVADAYDSMTRESGYRTSQNSEQAIAELFEKSDSQFDRKLVQSFASYVDSQSVWTNSGEVSKWLMNLAEMPRETNWSVASGFNTVGQFVAERSYQKSLLDMLSCGVVFMDLKKNVMLWNRAAEEITGLPSLNTFDRRWPTAHLDLHDEYDKKVEEDDCPVDRCLQHQKPLTITGSIRGTEQNSRRSIDLRLSPVFSPRSVMMGITVVMQDTSTEKNLKQRLNRMTIAATTDPLTQVANRSEFDRVYDQILVDHKEQKSPLSVIFADIDFFKRINDDYSHEAGDKALTSFAAHLSRNCGPGDLVSRFGGEEFVILCAETDIMKATERAEQIRSTLQALPQQMLKNRCITASFGVAQLQEGDTSSSLIRRADRALMKAKKDGRNRVVSLSGSAEISEATAGDGPLSKMGILSWIFGARLEGGKADFEKKLVTSVPVDIVIEKIRGFISDFNAVIKKTEANFVSFTLDSSNTNSSRRVNDRPTKYLVELRVQEPEADGYSTDTFISVSISLVNLRDRRRENALLRLDDVYRSLRSYMVAREFGEKITGTLERAATKPGEGRE